LLFLAKNECVELSVDGISRAVVAPKFLSKFQWWHAQRRAGAEWEITDPQKVALNTTIKKRFYRLWAGRLRIMFDGTGNG